jgi:hypothetical protein
MPGLVRTPIQRVSMVTRCSLPQTIPNSDLPVAGLQNLATVPVNNHTNFYHNPSVELQFFLMFNFGCFNVSFRYCLVVRIAGSHPAGPGSIPGNGKTYFVQPPSNVHFYKHPQSKKKDTKNRELDMWKFLLFSQGDTEPAWPNG